MVCERCNGELTEMEEVIKGSVLFFPVARYWCSRCGVFYEIENHNIQDLPKRAISYSPEFYLIRKTVGPYYWKLVALIENLEQGIFSLCFAVIIGLLVLPFGLIKDITAFINQKVRALIKQEGCLWISTSRK